MREVFIEEQSTGEAQMRQSLTSSQESHVKGFKHFDVDSPLHDAFSEHHSKDETKADIEINSISTKKFDGIEGMSLYPDLPDMWSLEYIGLYSQYAAVGLLYGSSGALLSLCVYVYDGSPNLCANSSNIYLFAWSFKIVFAIITDCYRPFGLRRKPWMIFGWSGTLLILLILTIVADKLDASSWLALLLISQFFAQFSDVPGDGYSVELGQLEPPERRGVILATGQMIRFSFCVLAGFIQAVFLNGPSTNVSNCKISFNGCFPYGLSINGYYGVLFALVLILTSPLLWLKELDSKTPVHSVQHHFKEIWETLQNKTTFCIIIFILGSNSLTNFKSVVNTYVQYYIIPLTSFQAGVDTITTYLALAYAIWIFKRYLINRDWRTIQYVSTIGTALLLLVWLLVFYNVGGLMNGWFTIFIDLDQYFVQGITQVLYSLSIIELSKPGLEATTYELVVTIGNAALTISSVIATQLLSPLQTSGCTNSDPSTCSDNSVGISGVSAFNSTDGPYRYTRYTVSLVAISIGCCLIFTPFLPTSKEECAKWKKQGEAEGQSKVRAYIGAFIAIATTAYGFTVAVLLLSPSTSCLEFVGGTGCN